MGKVVGVRCLEWLFLGAAVLSQSGCMSRLKPYLPGEQVPEGSVVLVGRLVMDPEIIVDVDGVADPGGMFRKVNLLFTNRPYKEVRTASQSDFVAQAPQGKILAVVAPRKALYVRGLHIVASMGGGGYTAFGQPMAPNVLSVECLGDLMIEPKPEDQVIYIGVLYCHHDRDTPELRVYDEWKEFEQKLRSYTDTSKVKMRFAKPR